MNPSLARELDAILKRPAELSYQSQLLVAARMLSRTSAEDMTATIVVGGLGDADVDAFRAMVRRLADEYGLDTVVTLKPGGFSVRFQR
jgi:hypothetical protein